MQRTHVVLRLSRERAPVLAAIAALAGCGGGGGGGAGSSEGGGVLPGGEVPGVIAPLADKPFVDPEELATPPLYAVQDATGFTAGAQASALRELDTTFRITTDDVVTIANGRDTLTFDDADVTTRSTAGLETRAAGAGSRSVRFFHPSGAAFDYITFGAWADADGLPTTTETALADDYGAFFDGSNAPDRAQTSGSARYDRGIVEGHRSVGGAQIGRIAGDAVAIADFDASTIETTLNLTAGVQDTISTGATPLDQSFRFSTGEASSERGLAGSLEGALFGPDASELAGAFDLRDEAGNERYVGAFGAVSPGLEGEGGGVGPDGDPEQIAPLPDKPFLGQDLPETPPVYAVRDRDGYSVQGGTSGIPERMTVISLNDGGGVTVRNEEYQRFYGGSDVTRRTAAGLETRESPEGDVIRYFNPGGAAFDYQTFGAWADSDAPIGEAALVETTDWGVFSGGERTPPNDLPTGGASYRGGLVEGFLVDGAAVQRIAGSATADADFGARSISTTLTLDRGASDVITSGAMAIDDALGFSTANASSEDGFSGDLTGAFFGPEAEEVGGEFDLRREGDDRRYVGAFAAGR